MEKLLAVLISLGVIPYTIILIVNKWLQGMRVLLKNSMVPLFSYITTGLRA
jgi:hypothetical protein